MSDYFRITVRFLQPFSHGRNDGDLPEWPPSPLRVFQALIAAAAARWNERTRLSTAVPALSWLQQQTPPVIVACAATASTVPTQLYVPDNSADLQVSAWKRGDTTAVVNRTDKVVLPNHLHGDSVCYLFPLEPTDAGHAEMLQTIARSITHVGWGIDMVAADADVITAAEAAALSGERWVAAASGGVALRTPTAGTLDDLIRKHQDFLNRLTDEGFRPVSPLREFAITHYRRDSDPTPRPACVFQILKPDASGNLAFNTARRTRCVAAWIRHAVAHVCQSAGWSDFLPFVHGHNADGSLPNSSANSSQRFHYLPLPTINSKLQRVESIRRVMVVAPAGFEDRIDFIRRRLLGHELRWDDQVVGLLNLQTGKDWVREQYVRPATTWSTVTPVILDGFNDHNARKTEKLLKKALANAGISVPVEFEHSPFGFRAGVEPVRDFLRPEKLNGSMVHVRLRFSAPFSGPLAIGAGRYRGFGLFAAEDAS
jgi:CRISPR-associated protein Csb2